MCRSGQHLKLGRRSRSKLSRPPSLSPDAAHCPPCLRCPEHCLSSFPERVSYRLSMLEGIRCLQGSEIQSRDADASRRSCLLTSEEQSMEMPCWTLLREYNIYSRTKVAHKSQHAASHVSSFHTFDSGAMSYISSKPTLLTRGHPYMSNPRLSAQPIKDRDPSITNYDYLPRRAVSAHLHLPLGRTPRPGGTAKDVISRTMVRGCGEHSMPINHRRPTPTLFLPSNPSRCKPVRPGHGRLLKVPKSPARQLCRLPHAIHRLDPIQSPLCAFPCVD